MPGTLGNLTFVEKLARTHRVHTQIPSFQTSNQPIPKHSKKEKNSPLKHVFKCTHTHTYTLMTLSYFQVVVGGLVFCVHNTMYVMPHSEHITPNSVQHKHRDLSTSALQTP